MVQYIIMQLLSFVEVGVQRQILTHLINHVREIICYYVVL